MPPNRSGGGRFRCPGAAAVVELGHAFFVKYVQFSLGEHPWAMRGALPRLSPSRQKKKGKNPAYPRNPPHFPRPSLKPDTRSRLWTLSSRAQLRGNFGASCRSQRSSRRLTASFSALTGGSSSASDLFVLRDSRSFHHTVAASAHRIPPQNTRIHPRFSSFVPFQRPLSPI